MDIRSFSLNYETMAVLYDEQKARELEAQFLIDHGTVARNGRWTPIATRRSGGGSLDSVYRLASPLL